MAAAERALTPKRALREWFIQNEAVDAAGGALSFAPQLNGFDPAVVHHIRHPEDGYYADVAQRYVSIRRGSQSYSARLARELDVSKAQARKLVKRCRERNLLDGDTLTPYALELLQEPAP